MKEGDNCIEILPINEFLLCIGFTAVHIPNFCADTLPGLQYGDPEVDKSPEIVLKIWIKIIRNKHCIVY